MIGPGVSGPDLAEVRQLEAVGFRSWPASNTMFDGTWAIRLTASHPAKRLNSVNPLDRGDNADLEHRIACAASRFDKFERPLLFRQSPLAPPALDTLLDKRNWAAFDESVVMTADLDRMDFSDTLHQVPLQNSDRWIDQCIAMGGFSDTVKSGMSELIAAVEGEVGLFLMEAEDGTAQSAAMAVRFGKLAGLFEVISNPTVRGRGHGRAIVNAALLWCRGLGSRRAWLQVVADNEVASGLYRSLGFKERYRYVYRQAPESE